MRNPIRTPADRIVCGICGFIGRADDAPLERMRDALAHRGPDERGSYSNESVHLAHRRLSVVDLKQGQQPFQSEDGMLVVVFNGEIYNHDELRSTLERRGHAYRTESDTESIIHAYREYGERCPEHLDGMFAFVLFDKRKRTLFGARDRFGKKPLFYSTPPNYDGRAFVFASEIRSLLLHPAVARTTGLSEDAVISYLLHDYVPGEATAFRGIFRIPQGHAFRISIDNAIAERPEMWRYWQNPVLAAESFNADEDEIAAEVDRLLDAAVRRRLMADVPLGVFLSGGVDSSAIVAFLSRHMNPAEIRTFSIGFDDPSFDESEYAAAAAAHFGTNHSTRRFTARDCLDELGNCIRHMDEPLADPSIVPTSLLSKFARESVTVALGGDGGDELFAGYDPFKALAAAHAYDALIPPFLHRAITGLSRGMPQGGANMSVSFRVDRFLRGAKVPEAERMTSWMGSFDSKGVAALLDNAPEEGIRERFLGSERALFAAIPGVASDHVRSSLAYFQSFYLVDDILVKADRASMMHSLELRSPFLDTALAEFVNPLPSHFKYRGGTTKYILKKVLARGANGGFMVPRALLRRPKKGFGIPVSRWIRGELRETFKSALVTQWPDKLHFLKSSHIESMLNLHLTGARDYGKELWALYMLSGWVRNWVK